MEICPYCINDGKTRLLCGTSFETGDGFVYICSRIQDHDGEHVACGEEHHDIARGKDDCLQSVTKP